MQHIAVRLTLAFVLALGTTLSSGGLASASHVPLAFQEDQSQPPDSGDGEEAPPPEQPAEPPASGPGSDQPWYQWRNEVPMDKQAFGTIHYQEFWALRTEALGDPGIEAELNLSGVMDGEALQKELDFLHMLEAKGQAQVVMVEHRPSIVYADDDNYVILDSYLDRSYLVDAKTRAHIGGGPPAEPTVVNEAFHIQKTSDPMFPGFVYWKVVESTAVELVS